MSGQHAPSGPRDPNFGLGVDPATTGRLYRKKADLAGAFDCHSTQTVCSEQLFLLYKRCLVGPETMSPPFICIGFSNVPSPPSLPLPSQGNAPCYPSCARMQNCTAVPALCVSKPKAGSHTRTSLKRAPRLFACANCSNKYSRKEHLLRHQLNRQSSTPSFATKT
ncbi:hypothetical protein N658DRAFT_260779 [Parathielavia hyrcaniae]|uniref:C2H2-type domain-containing protein n=1 Tax=Parathielavia hyrcaniae TaxID=113614 RepID=A0AAN6PYD6_9PEZI|nr:hypothetical protein N658DRAFT_260779 [Parathielavia hyrcaniae]